MVQQPMRDKLSEHKIVVVGAGPTALAFLDGYLQNNPADIPVVLCNGELPKNAAKKNWYSAFDNRNNLKPFGGCIEGYKKRSNVEKNTDVYESNIVGGFGRYWGRVCNEPNDIDLRGAGLTREEFDQQINAMNRTLIDFSVVSAGLVNGVIASVKLPYSQFQARLFERLTKSNMFAKVSASPIAIHKNSDGNRCRDCGHCIAGCPEAFLFDPSEHLRNLQSAGKILLIENFDVNSIAMVSEAKFSKWRVNCLDGRTLNCDKVVLCGGAFSTFNILFRSKMLKAKKYRMADTVYFHFPALSLLETKNKREEITSLSFATLELKFSQMAKPIQIQLYGFNYVYENVLSKLKYLPDVMKRIVSRRLMLIQCFFHSVDSPPIEISVDQGTVCYCGTKYSILSIIKHYIVLASKFIRLGVIALPVLNLAKPARSFHNGGWATPEIVDFLPKDLFIADSSVISEFPGSSMTIILMAKARKLGVSFGH